LQDTLKIGMIGLDTSHCTAFAELLHRPEHPYHVQGGRITVAYAGGSPEIPLSWSRVKGFTESLRDNYNVHIVNSVDEVVEQADALMIESMDGAVHKGLFEEIASYGKPVFIDKPLALSSQEANQIHELAIRYHTPIMSSSSLRFSGALSEALQSMDGDAIIGADCYGPMALEPSQPGLFWYGIHSVEMLYAILGKGCRSLTSAMNADYDLIVGEWADGRIGTIRGNRIGNGSFGALIHGSKGNRLADISAYPKPFYASLLEQIIQFFRTGECGMSFTETVEIIRFIEAANESRRTGQRVVI